MTCFELGNHARADLILEELERYVAESGNEYMIKMIRLAKAEMEFRKGEIEKAFQLTQKIDSLPLRPVTNFFAPQLIMAKIWIYYRIPSCNEEASLLLDETESYLLRVNNNRFLIDLYALKSIYNFDAGNLEISMKYLVKAVKLARPGGFIRVFTDMGEKMREVILASTMSARDDTYIDQILTSFKNKIKHAPVDALSMREKEILQYLSQKLSNKEIGTKLFITEKTVKNHLNSIYRKLDVSGRREAYNKAREKDLLQK
jgi:LuxR family maltose regulon positive regulatory protein